MANEINTNFSEKLSELRNLIQTTLDGVSFIGKKQNSTTSENSSNYEKVVLIKKCYGSESPDEVYDNPQEGQIYFQLQEPSTTTSEFTENT